MKKAEKNLLIFVALTLVALFLLSSTNLVLGEKKTDVYVISVLVNDNSTKSWDNFRHGMDKAAEKWNVDVSFVTLYDQANVSQQTMLMEREVKNGAEALILAPTDCLAMGEAVDKIPAGVPVVMVGAGVDSPRVRSVVATDPALLGAELGNRIFTDHKTKDYSRVVEVTYHKNRTDTDALSDSMWKALPDYLPVHRVVITVEDELDALLVDLANQRTPTAVVGLDAAATLALADRLELLEPDNLTLYGMGWSSALLRHADNGAFAAVGVANDYDMGYLSLETAVKYLRRERVESRYTVGQALIPAGKIHDKEYEMLLFPIF